jgi:hypothetical protein
MLRIRFSRDSCDAAIEWRFWRIARKIAIGMDRFWPTALGSCRSMRIENSQITFADLEFLQQGVRLDPLLEKISDFLDNHDELEEIVRCDLERDLKEPETGRPGLTPGQVLRSLILMRIKDWDYRELRERINDGYTLRKFTGF